MFSALRDRLRRTVGPWTLGLRLVLGYAVLFVSSTVLLSLLAYALFLHYMREPDRAFVEEQARELYAAYAENGLQGLRTELTATRSGEVREELLVRISDPTGRTLLLYNPDDWESAELARVEGLDVPAYETWMRLGPAEDEDALGLYAIRLPGGGMLQVGTDTDVREDVLESMRNVFLAIALPIVFLALLGGAAMAYRALKPIRQFVYTLERVIGTGNMHERVPAPETRGEFTELVTLFNRMLERIQGLVEGMGRTLDNVAHDLRTPMTHLRGKAELALHGDRDAAAYRQALAGCIEASDQVLAMLDTLMDVSEAEAGMLALHRESVSLADLLENVAEPYRFYAEQKNVRFDVAAPDAQIYVDPGRLRQVIANLLDNALKYTPEGGRVRLTGSLEGANGVISVSDTGIGIPEPDLPHVWDRLYRGDASRSERGLGLGLSLVKAIVEAHGGRVEVSSAWNSGSTFTIYLPAGARVT